MVTVPNTDKQLREAVAAYEEHGGVKAYAAKSLGLAPATFKDRLRVAEKRFGISLGKVAGGSVQGISEEVRPLPRKGEIKRYIITSAQNNTHINIGVWENLQALAHHYNAELMVGTFSYNKAAYGWKSVKRGTANSNSQESNDWYDKALEPFIVDHRVELAPGLVWCGEMNILPTAEDPLSSFETYTGRRSGIFPHVKMELRSIASGKFEATKFNYTTGTITLRNYIQKKAGLKAEFHHVYGAVVVEVNSAGSWWVRQLNADSGDGIQDLTLYAQLGQVTTGHFVEGITWGDIHAEQLDPEVCEIAWGVGGVLDTLHPSFQFMHDTLAASSGISHHDRKSPHKQFSLFSAGKNDMGLEMEHTAAFLGSLSHRDWCQTVVVDSNHDRHLERWLEETNHKEDNVNALFYLKTSLALYEAMAREDMDFHLVEYCLLQAGCPKDILFLQRGESFIICADKTGGIECGMHGDEGANGARGGGRGLSKLGRKANVGHTHTAEIRHGLYTSGLSALMDLGYNTGPGSWSHSLTVTYPNGKRTIITMWAGRAWALPT